VKLGVSYNVFDGEELLRHSILCIRKYVDFVCVVYQNTSNFGEERDDLEEILCDLQEEGLVDYSILYKPQVVKDSGAGPFNEIRKRNIGKHICKQRGCTHHITMDCDEMYISEEFKKAKELVQKKDYDTSYVNYVNYYKKPTLQFAQSKEGFFSYVSFIVKCDDRLYGEGKVPVLLDPTRKIHPDKFFIFPKEDIQMHHYSYIRGSEKSLRRKLNNTSCKTYMPGMEKWNDEILQRHKNYKDGDKILIPNMPSKKSESNLIKVEDRLNLDIKYV
jgi:hypothetical protein|tara:strand:- start:777 stop:1598 length:822 start_codon:yes stop_codon:yes gene_type:complete